MSNKYFKNKNAVITGAASGIGKEFAIALAKMGTNLLLSDIDIERLEQTKEELTQYNVKVVTMKCDVTKQIDAKKQVKKAISELGEIHFLFSNAGIAVGGKLEDLLMTQYNRIIDINLYGMINVIKAFMPTLASQGFGHVIVTSSIAGTVGIGGLSPYNTTKFANAGFCESLYGEFHSKGINVSIVCPFPLKTNLIESVGIGISSDLLAEIEPAIIKEAIEVGKIHYWEKFTEKCSIQKGFAGGFTVERAVKRYIKKIRKKKLYIYERRYGRLLLFLKGFWPGLYKRFLDSIGQKHISLISETIDMCVEMAKKENSSHL